LCLFSGYCAFFFIDTFLKCVNKFNVIKTGRLTQLARKLSEKTHALTNYNPNNPNRPQGKNWVTMSNALTRASHGLSLAEKRLVMCAVAKLDSAKTAKPPDTPNTRITAAEYSETFSVDLDTAYDQLASAAKALHNRCITFYEPAYRRNGKSLPPTKIQMNWIGEIHYQKGEGWVELYWWHKVIPHLFGLKKHFTSYQLQQASALRSIYSWRLLELLMRFKSTGYAEYSIEDFCQSMEATEKQRQNFAAIRRRIIEPAVKELNEKDGWIITWQPIKGGRRVKALRFDFKKDPQGRLF